MNPPDQISILARTLVLLAVIFCPAVIAAAPPAVETKTETETETETETAGAVQDVAPVAPEDAAAGILDAIDSLPPVTSAVDPGQVDLDEAVVKRMDAETNSQLESVAMLIETAIKKGLSEENEAFAKKMLGSVQLQRGQGLAGVMLQVRGRQQLQVRDEALRALNQAVAHDSTLVDAWLLIARLNLVSGGDETAIATATTKAIELLTDRPEELSSAFLLRSITKDDDAEKMADLNAALDAAPENIDALRERAAVRLRSGEVDEALKDLQSVLTLDPSNQQIAGAAVEQLMQLDRAGDAVKLLSDSIAARPTEGLYRLRAILYRMLDREGDALEDLNKAIAMQPKDPVSLLQRAEISLSRDDVQGAKRDYKMAVAIEPRIEQVEQGILVRCFISVAEKRMADAIADMKQLIRLNPDDVARQLQLASFYLQDDRPKQAINTLSSMLEKEPKNVNILRSRADAFLAVGDHAAAIRDYEVALSALGNDQDSPFLSGILNNLAWVLATSPNDDVRDGDRSVELGLRAVELTKESEPHILSTLAAGYAEKGDFENAIKWSEKAVQSGAAEANEQLEQLQKELESYRKQEPWREKQETPENKLPLLSPDDLIDT